MAGEGVPQHVRMQVLPQFAFAGSLDPHLDRPRTETATLFIFTAIEERMYSEAYIVALTLAAVSIVLLVTIETTRHRIEGRKVRT